MRTLRKADIESMERELQELHSMEKASIIGGGNGIYVLADGVIVSNSYGSTIYYENGNCMYINNVQISTNWVTPDAGYQWNGVIHISQSENWSIDGILHEYGHYIQQQEMGRWDYFWRVAIPSMWSLLTNPSNHNTKWFEVDATKKGSEYQSNNMGNCDNNTTGNEPYYDEEWYQNNWGEDISGFLEDLMNDFDSGNYFDYEEGSGNDYYDYYYYA
jgi:hypothetical protein